MSNSLPSYLKKPASQYRQTKLNSISVDPTLYQPNDPVGWIEEHFWIPETEAPIRLEPYQKAVIEEALRRDVDGNFVYSLILYSDIKKSAKSTIAAAICLFLAWHTQWETVRIVANDLRQADSRTFFYIERAVRGNKRLAPPVCSIKLYHIGLPNNTTIEAIPVDPSGEAGGGDLVTCFTELWAFKNEAAKRLWSETTLSPLKFGRSIRWCESYAGFDGHSPVLEQLYDVGVRNGRVKDVGIEGLELYTNEAARQLTLWNTVPRCTWQTDAYYAQEASSLVPSEFARMHRNQWQSSSDAFIPIEWWDACKGDVTPGSRNVVIGADAAVSNDCFALAVIGKRGSQLVILRTYIWTPPKGGQIDFEGPKQKIRDLAKEFYVLEVAYDPHQLAGMMQELRKEGINCKEFLQGDPRLVADKKLHDAIRDRTIVHDGNAELRQHVQNADKKTDGDDSRLRIVKRNEAAKIDACVAVSMGAQRASVLNL